MLLKLPPDRLRSFSLSFKWLRHFGSDIWNVLCFFEEKVVFGLFDQPARALTVVHPLPDQMLV